MSPRSRSGSSPGRVWGRVRVRVRVQVWVRATVTISIYSSVLGRGRVGIVYKVNVTMSVLPIGYTRRCPFGTRCETQPACEVRFWGQNYLGLGLLVERTNQRSSSVRFQSVPVRVTRTLTRTVAQCRSQSAPWPG